MTTRVFDLQKGPSLSLPAAGYHRHTRRAGLKGAALAAIILVPVAGAGEPPLGWLAAGLGALGVLCAAAMFGSRIRWGWLAVVAGGSGLVLPRGPWGMTGPPLFVATCMCVMLWLAQRGNARGAGAAHSGDGNAVRAAQLMLGFSGERQVGRALGKELPQDFAVINGLELPRGAGDIDHLVVGPTGVFLLETKTMAGRITCAADGSWHRTRIGRGGSTYAAYVGDPAAQVQRNIFALRQALRTRLPDLFRGTPLWIEGLVVFPHPNTELETGHSRVPAVLLADASLRICAHSPRRRLQPNEVDAIVRALLAEAHSRRVLTGRRSAQAVVELALALPVVLGLVFGTVGVSRLVQTRSAVIAVAHEAARAGALASSPPEAIDRMRQRAALVAPGLGLDTSKLVLGWDLSHFNNEPGRVEATVEYPVDLGDLPVVGTVLSTRVRAAHVEWIDPFRSGIGAQAGGGD
jgi:hypothetical protein